MEAKKLMIGDWVKVFDGFKRITQIRNVSNKKEFYSVWCDEWGLYESDLEPIPLTAEILEKNGWKYNDMPFVQGWEQYGILLYACGSGYRINCGTNIALIIDSVHELQHALRLCGIDKEIVL